MTMTESTTRRVLLVGSLMAAIAGVVYLAIALGMTPEDFESPPRPLMFVAGAIYIAGAGVMHLVGRRLLVAGAVANAIVIALFLLSAARGNATVDALSLSGKAAQVALEAILLWAVWRGTSEPRRA